MTFILHAACGRLDPEPVATPQHCQHAATDRTASGICGRCGHFVGVLVVQAAVAGGVKA